METTAATGTQPCRSCLTIAHDHPGTAIHRWSDAIAIRLTDGAVNDQHFVVLPRTHTANAAADPEVTAIAMCRAAELMATLPAANIITSTAAPGPAAADHCAIHVIGRRPGDGLALPWTPQQARRPAGTPTPTSGPCIFGLIRDGEAPATFVQSWVDAFAIRALEGVNPNHTLVIPRVHTADAGEDPDIAAIGMRRAAELMATYPTAHVITSKGRAATQSVYHCHIHVLTPDDEDGNELPLPWPSHLHRISNGGAR